MSGSGLFGIARSALLSHQTALQTISHNIANAETPGYSRQEAVLAATTPVRFSYGNVGTGVAVDTILRKRDVLLDEGFRTANGQAGQAQLRSDLLGRVETVFGEPSDAGMAAALDAFWGAWSDAATSPGTDATRAVVQQRGRQLAQLFNQYDTRLTEQRTSAIDRLTGTVAEINQLAAQVAELNGRIVGSEGGSRSANDLRDQRDRLLDRLSGLAGTRSVPQADGTVTVVIGNSTLVDSTTVRPLAYAFDPPPAPPAAVPADLPITIRLEGSVDRLFPLGGELATLNGFLNTDIPTLRGRLDALAQAVVTAVNAEHVQGFTFTGTAIPGAAAGNFFDPGSVAAPVRAGSIRLAAAVDADARAIATSRDANAPFDNGTALALAGLRTSTDGVSYTAPGGGTETAGFLAFFRTTVTRLGLDVQMSADDATVQRTLADQADTRRQAVSGVNTDEELVQMLRIQQAYVAATKLIQTADEMLDTLLALV